MKDNLEIMDYYQVYMPLLSFNQHKNGDRGRSPENLQRPMSRESTQLGIAWEDTKLDKEEFNVQVEHQMHK